MPSESAPANWYDSPGDSSVLRYWDGAAWTEHTSPKNAPLAVPASAVDQNGRNIALLGTLAAAIGSIGPWATIDSAFGSISVSGTSGDGVITLCAAALAFVLLFAEKYAGAAVVLALLAAVAVYDLTNLSRLAAQPSSFVSASAGWGIWLVAVGGVLAFFGALKANKAKRPNS